MLLARFLNGVRVVVRNIYLLWFLLALPGLYWLFAYRQGIVFYGEFIHASGELATQLLIATLAVTPLRLLFPKQRWPRWLLARRRYLGVAAFGYSLLHALVYIQRRPDFTFILDEALELAMAGGWIALLIMLILALTSNDASVRRLGRDWKVLHRLVYPAAALTFAHWILSAFDPVPGFMYLGILVILGIIRLWKSFSIKV